MWKSSTTMEKRWKVMNTHVCDFHYAKKLCKHINDHVIINSKMNTWIWCICEKNNKFNDETKSKYHIIHDWWVYFLVVSTWSIIKFNCWLIWWHIKYSHSSTWVREKMILFKNVTYYVDLQFGRNHTFQFLGIN